VIESADPREAGATACPLWVLVVEDNEADVFLLVHLFQEQIPEWPVHLLALDDGAKALRHLMDERAPKPDLVILDLNLPQIDGADLLAFIRLADHLYGLPVIVFSTYPEDVIKDRAGSSAECYISKRAYPDSWPVLAARIRQCFERRS
jgi:CheY-like chemotaxis protein